MRVFVNYRRRDTRHVAGRLRDLIVDRFGEGSVFVDVESIEPGMSYVRAINAAVGNCDVMLVLIGDQWLESSDDQGRRRIDDPTDRLRLEIEAGLSHQTRVIPVLVDSASMPTAQDLPTSLRPLASHQSIRLDHESFRSDAERLLRAVEPMANVHSGASGTQTPGQENATQRAARWMSVALLITVVLSLFALRSGVIEAVAASRAALFSDRAWAASLTWLLPVGPLVVAATLAALRTRPGAALGWAAGALIWLCISLTFVVWRQPGEVTSEHLFLLALLVLSMLCLVVAEPAVRAPAGLNEGPRAAIALVLIVAAVVLRTQAALMAELLTDTPGWAPGAINNLGMPPFWIAALIPVVVCLPAATLRLNAVQTRMFVTIAILQIAFPVYQRTLAIIRPAEDNPSVAAIDALIFIAGSFCMLLAVHAGQRPTVDRAGSAIRAR